MRRMTVLAAAGTIAVALGVIGFTLGRALTFRGPVTTGMTANVPAQPQASSVPPLAFLPPARPAAAIPMPSRANATATPSPACGNPDALAVSRVVEIDTTGGPAFGFEHFKQYDFLRDKEVVLTFDDGPWPANTAMVLKALTDNCTKATFFEIGEHATWHPEISKE